MPPPSSPSPWASASVAPLPAHAAPAFNRNVSYSDFMSRDVLMGAFFTNDGDHSDTLYLSTDGKQFDELGIAYQDATPGNPNDDTSTLGSIHHTLGDPSIMYHDGAFWMLSGWNRHDGNSGPPSVSPRTAKPGPSPSTPIRRRQVPGHRPEPRRPLRHRHRRPRVVPGQQWPGVRSCSALATSVSSTVAPTRTAWFPTW
ncbi:MAG: hypothetical protein U1U88_001528 [Lawsonella clevelandensis]